MSRRPAGEKLRFSKFCGVCDFVDVAMPLALLLKYHTEGDLDGVV